MKFLLFFAFLTAFITFGHSAQIEDDSTDILFIPDDDITNMNGIPSISDEQTEIIYKKHSKQLDSFSFYLSNCDYATFINATHSLAVLTEKMKNSSPEEIKTNREAWMADFVESTQVIIIDVPGDIEHKHRSFHQWFHDQKVILKAKLKTFDRKALKQLKKDAKYIVKHYRIIKEEFEGSHTGKIANKIFEVACLIVLFPIYMPQLLFLMWINYLFYGSN